jgi:extradiol dioxygenase family protein
LLFPNLDQAGIEFDQGHVFCVTKFGKTMQASRVVKKNQFFSNHFGVCLFLWKNILVATTLGARDSGYILEPLHK